MTSRGATCLAGKTNDNRSCLYTKDTASEASCSSCLRTLCLVDCWHRGFNQWPWYELSCAHSQITETGHISTASIVLQMLRCFKWPHSIHHIHGTPVFAAIPDCCQDTETWNGNRAVGKLACKMDATLRPKWQIHSKTKKQIQHAVPSPSLRWIPEQPAMT